MSIQTPDPRHYAYRVVWSPADGEYVATVAEFPSLSWLAETQADALAGITALVADVLDDMVTTGEVPPIPLAERAYSGKFMVRVPEDLHRSLALTAAEQRISLNRLVTDRLARA